MEGGIKTGKKWRQWETRIKTGEKERGAKSGGKRRRGKGRIKAQEEEGRKERIEQKTGKITGKQKKVLVEKR